MNAQAPRGAVSELTRAEPRDLWQWVTAQEHARIVRHAGQVAVRVVLPAVRGARAAWFAKFAARQRNERRWICCADLADWCARRQGSIRLDDGEYEEACRQLILSLFDGEFVAGRDCPLLLTRAGLSRLSPEVVHSLMQWWPAVWSRGTLGASGDRLRSQLAWAISPGDGWSRTTATELRWLVAHIWIPREAARLWVENRDLRLPPWLAPFTLAASATATRAGNKSRPRAGVPAIKMKISKETKWREWLTKQMRAAPTQPRTKVMMKDEGRAACLPDCGDRAFDRAWTAAVEASGASDWAHAGRRKSLRSP